MLSFWVLNVKENLNERFYTTPDDVNKAVLLTCWMTQYSSGKNRVSCFSIHVYGLDDLNSMLLVIWTASCQICYRMGRSRNSSMFSSEAAKSGVYSFSSMNSIFASNLFWIFTNSEFCRFMVIPDMLKNAPMFKRLEARIKVPFLLPDLISSFLLLMSVIWLTVINFQLWRARVHRLGLDVDVQLQCELG